MEGTPKVFEVPEDTIRASVCAFFPFSLSIKRKNGSVKLNKNKTQFSPGSLDFISAQYVSKIISSRLLFFFFLEIELRKFLNFPEI